MAYKMRYRVDVYLVGQGAAEVAEEGDTLVASAGDFADPPTSKVLSLNAAVSLGLSFVRRFQSGVYANARASVFGQPVGEPEAGNEDIDAALKLEREYIRIDTPQPALVFQMARANRKNTVTAAFEPVVDPIPELNDPA